MRKSIKGNTHAGHEFVDLGLPSGTLWATTNVGAVLPEDPGGYISWGGDSLSFQGNTKDNFNYKTYKWYRKNGAGSDYFDENYYTKYNPIDGFATLQYDDDIAHSLWRGLWHTPSLGNVEELIENCYFVKINNNKELAMCCTSNINSQSIIIPCAGYFFNHLFMTDSHAYFWTSTLGYRIFSAYAGTFALEDEHLRIGVTIFGRYCGLPVRPVI